MLNFVLNREINGSKCGASVNDFRKTYQYLHPDTSVHGLQAPPAFISRFSPDGQYLLTFSGSGQQLIVYHFVGHHLCTQGELSREEVLAKLSSFDSFFSLAYRTVLCPDSEKLCRDFALFPPGASTVILASQTLPARQGEASQLSNAAGMNQEIPKAEVTTLHLVSLADGCVLDRVVFKDDYIFLQHNAGVSIREDLVAVLGVHSQVVHLVHITHGGTRLTRVQEIGQYLHEDDELSLQIAADEESKWAARSRSLGSADCAAAGMVSMPALPDLLQEGRGSNGSTVLCQTDATALSPLDALLDDVGGSTVVRHRASSSRFSLDTEEGLDGTMPRLSFDGFVPLPPKASLDIARPHTSHSSAAACRGVKEVPHQLRNSSGSGPNVSTRHSLSRKHSATHSGNHRLSLSNGQAVLQPPKEPECRAPTIFANHVVSLLTPSVNHTQCQKPEGKTNISKMDASPQLGSLQLMKSGHQSQQEQSHLVHSNVSTSTSASDYLSSNYQSMEGVPAHSSHAPVVPTSMVVDESGGFLFPGLDALRQFSTESGQGAEDVSQDLSNLSQSPSPFSSITSANDGYEGTTNTAFPQSASCMNLGNLNSSVVDIETKFDVINDCKHNSQSFCHSNNAHTQQHRHGSLLNVFYGICQHTRSAPSTTSSQVPHQKASCSAAQWLLSWLPHAPVAHGQQSKCPQVFSTVLDSRKHDVDATGRAMPFARAGAVESQPAKQAQHSSLEVRHGDEQILPSETQEQFWSACSGSLDSSSDSGEFSTSSLEEEVHMCPEFRMRGADAKVCISRLSQTSQHNFGAKRGKGEATKIQSSDVYHARDDSRMKERKRSMQECDMECTGRPMQLRRVSMKKQVDTSETQDNLDHSMRGPPPCHSIFTLKGNRSSIVCQNQRPRSSVESEKEEEILLMRRSECNYAASAMQGLLQKSQDAPRHIVGVKSSSASQRNIRFTNSKPSSRAPYILSSSNPGIISADQIQSAWASVRSSSVENPLQVSSLIQQVHEVRANSMHSEVSTAAALNPRLPSSNQGSSSGPDTTGPVQDMSRPVSSSLHHISPDLQHARQASNSVDGVQPQEAARVSQLHPQLIQGIPQRILAFLYKRCLESSAQSPLAREQELKQFRARFDAIAGLFIWRACLLDRHHLLLDMGPSTPCSDQAAGRPTRQPTPAHSTQLYAVYSIPKACVIATFGPSSQSLMSIMTRHAELCQAEVGNLQWDRFTFGAPHAAIVRSAIASQISRGVNKQALARKVLAALPCVPHAHCSSPYLDATLFHYNERSIGPFIRHRPCSQEPIRFRPLGGQLFELSPGWCQPRLGGTDRELNGGNGGQGNIVAAQGGLSAHNTGSNPYLPTHPAGTSNNTGSNNFASLPPLGINGGGVLSDMSATAGMSLPASEVGIPRAHLTLVHPVFPFVLSVVNSPGRTPSLDIHFKL